MKQRRHEAILRAIRGGEIQTQARLLDALLAQGIAATQATVSRDIRELGLKKVPKPGGSGAPCYAAAERLDTGLSAKLRAILSNAVLSADSAGHTVCVRCGAGMANAACTAVDALRLESVVGSLAGDDTIFLLCRSEEAALAVREEMERYAAKLND
ncbi:MAG: hypothetical protein FWH26_04275 [Oscillospiraceae bacterium]|nr:hypothetical protein [Oscillospiraceae bacterium]